MYCKKILPFLVRVSVSLLVDTVLPFMLVKLVLEDEQLMILHAFFCVICRSSIECETRVFLLTRTIVHVYVFLCSNSQSHHFLFKLHNEQILLIDWFSLSWFTSLY